MRRTAREIALKMLFQKEFATPISPRDWLHHIYDEESLFQSAAKAPTQIPKESLQFAEVLVRGVTQFQIDIDNLIKNSAQHWSMDRMATLDRNLLRLGVYEMHFAKEPTPASVSINEAVELAKIYGTKESAGFINGILDQIQKSRSVSPKTPIKSSAPITPTAPLISKPSEENTKTF